MATMPGLRPLATGEILDAGIKIYTRHWRVLMGCVVWVVLPVQIVSVLITLSIAPEQLDFTTTSPDAGVAPGEEDAFVASQLVIALLQGFVYMVTTAACFKAVSGAYLGATPDIGRSLRFAVRRLPALLVLGVVTVAALVPAFLLLIVPGIWLAIAWSLAVPALLFERVTPVAALRRSFRLVEGRWWRVCGTLIVGVLLVSFMGGILAGLLVVIPSLLAGGNDAVAAVATVVGSTVASVITTPFTAAVVALVYYDQRVRKEGFDRERLADGLGEERA
ncbi:MAG: hypothetical protein ACRDK0_06405, partial [Solirubrobacteraceae bacterium]